jgi:hypothetical protein
VEQHLALEVVHLARGVAGCRALPRRVAGTFLSPSITRPILDPDGAGRWSNAAISSGEVLVSVRLSPAARSLLAVGVNVTSRSP